MTKQGSREPACIRPPGPAPDDHWDNGETLTGEVDAVALRRNVERWAPTGIRGLVIGGSTGEAVFLDERERDLSWDVVARSVPDDLLLVAGTGVDDCLGVLLKLFHGGHDVDVRDVVVVALEARDLAGDVVFQGGGDDEMASGDAQLHVASLTC